MVTKAKISQEISSNINLPNNKSKKILESFLLVIKKHSRSKKIKISGFGTFYTSRTKQRMGRNPKTKKSYIIRPINKLKFTPSNKIRKNIN